MIWSGTFKDSDQIIYSNHSKEYCTQINPWWQIKVECVHILGFSHIINVFDCTLKYYFGFAFFFTINSSVLACSLIRYFSNPQNGRRRWRFTTFKPNKTSRWCKKHLRVLSSCQVKRAGADTFDLVAGDSRFSAPPPTSSFSLCVSTNQWN